MMRSCCGLVGAFLVVLLYSLIGLHFYAFLTVIAPLLKSRLGEKLGMIWVAVGLTLLFNIMFNHFWATVIKPGGPKD